MWRQLEGPPLAEMKPSADGFTLEARLATLAQTRPGPVPWGVVPVSPATRGDVVLIARWAAGPGVNLTRQIRVSASPRSRGLPNTPVGVRVTLGGEGWHVTARPANSAAALEIAAGVASLLPDVAGDWRLADGGGRTLALRSGRYDETPLDCGRAGCHAAIAAAAAASPMTTVLARLLDAKTRPAGYPACALACHATGEPGAADGGFAHVAAELGPAGDLDRRWGELPRDLHRLGGVGCLACHGPGAIPEPSARWSVLRADVCAVCHDAPPRYGHVAAWRATAMARADQDPRARHERACARCHTTWGFLETVATPERIAGARRPPDEAGPIGITCSACHAVHDPKRPGARALLRETPTPALLAGAANSVCLSCHSPAADDPRPSASAAALWLGRGGLDPATGAALTGAPLHAGVAGGCIGCHRGGPDVTSESSKGAEHDEPPATGSRGQSPRSATQDLERGATHGFRASSAACAQCHGPRAPAPDVRARARELWRALRGEDGGAPAHAGDLAVDRRTPLGRALWDLLLVLEDPGAGTHNARYAAALLDAAAPVIEASLLRKAR